MSVACWRPKFFTTRLRGKLGEIPSHEQQAGEISLIKKLQREGRGGGGPTWTRGGDDAAAGEGW